MPWHCQAALVGASGKRPHKLMGNCGISHIWGMLEDPRVDAQSPAYLNIEHLPEAYSGLSVASFNRDQEEAYNLIKEKYKILYESDWVKNRSPVAGSGAIKGIKIVVFQHGKMEVVA